MFKTYKISNLLKEQAVVFVKVKAHLGKTALNEAPEVQRSVRLVNEIERSAIVSKLTKVLF